MRCTDWHFIWNLPGRETSSAQHGERTESLQASAGSQIWNNEHKLKDTIKMFIKFCFSPFYVCDSTFVPHSISHKSEDHWPLGASSIGLMVLTALKSCLEAQNPRRSQWFRDKLESQESNLPRASVTHCREFRWKADKCPRPPASSFFSVFASAFPLHPRNLGEDLPVPAQLCRRPEQPSRRGFRAVSPMKPVAWGRLWMMALLWETRVLKTRTAWWTGSASCCLLR